MFTLKNSSILGNSFVIIFFLILSISLGLKISDFIDMKFSFKLLIVDISVSFLRVTIVAIIAWLCGIIIGYFLHHFRWLNNLFLPTINFIRHISPFAWLPFAIIWFGLGEIPVAFIIFITLFFPTTMVSASHFAEIPQDYIDEAKVNGANNWQLLKFIEIPFTIVGLLNLFRVIWGLGWTIIIAAEMLGVESGIGFRLLDFRYLLKYPQMVIYLFAMGILGILNDITIFYIIKNLKKKTQ